MLINFIEAVFGYNRIFFHQMYNILSLSVMKVLTEIILEIAGLGFTEVGFTCFMLLDEETCDI